MMRPHAPMADARDGADTPMPATQTHWPRDASGIVAIARSSYGFTSTRPNMIRSSYHLYFMEWAAPPGLGLWGSASAAAAGVHSSRILYTGSDIVLSEGRTDVCIVSKVYCYIYTARIIVPALRVDQSHCNGLGRGARGHGTHDPYLVPVTISSLS